MVGIWRGSGTEGKDPYYHLECAFCGQQGKFNIVAHHAKTEPNGGKALNYDVASCANCGNITMVFWTVSTLGGGRPLHSARQLPWPLEKKSTPSKIWPEQVARYWIQAKDNLARKNFDMAIVAARTALQCTARERGAVGPNLKAEIEDLATKADLPANMEEWAHIAIRDPGNDNAHPAVGQPAATAQDAKDVIGYLDFLLEYVYDLPARIQAFRARPDAAA